MKKVLLIALVLMFAFSVAACTSNQVAQQPTQAASTAAVQASTAATAAATAEASAAVSAVTSATTDLMKDKTGKEAPPMTKTKITMGLCPTAMNTQYQMVIDGVKQYIYDNKLKDVINLVVQAPSGQSAVDEQVEIVEGWIQQKFDVICMCTANQGAMEPVYKEASEKGIPIFEFNTPNLTMSNPYYVSNVSSDQRGAGHAVGKWMAETFKEPINLAILEGLPGVHNTERLGGFYDALKESGETNIKVVASQPADWVRDRGQAVTENLLTSHPEIQMIWGLYDEMALGAVAACKDAKRTDIKIVGYDNTPDANAAIKRGEMYATVDTASKAGGYDLTAAVYKYCIKGEMVAKYITQEVKVYDVNTINDFSMDNYTYVEK
jgi:ribose transport system substrate-binding protein